MWREGAEAQDEGGESEGAKPGVRKMQQLRQVVERGWKEGLT